MRRSGTNPTAAAIGLLQLPGPEGAGLLEESARRRGRSPGRIGLRRGRHPRQPARPAGRPALDVHRRPGRWTRSVAGTASTPGR